jgi:PAS domain S-box-containing protein
LAPRRSASGQRLYTEEDVERVAAACLLVEQGLTLSAAIGRVISAGSGALTINEGETSWLHRVLQATDAAIWVSQDTQTRYVNRRMAELLRCSIDELLERSVFDFIDPDDVEATKERGRLERTGKRSSFEVRMRRADSSPFLAEISTTPLRTPNGALEGAVAVVHDVTVRNREASEARFRNALLDAIGEGVIATRTDGTIVYANPAAESLLGWRASELVGQNGLEILPTRDEGGSQQIHAGLLAGNRFSGELDLARRDGIHFLAHVTGTPVHDNHNEPVGLIAVLSDSSERRRQEQDVRNHEQQAETVAFLGLRALQSAPNDLDLVLAEAVEATRRVLQSDRAALFERLPGDDELAVRVTSPHIDQPITVQFGSRSLTGYTALAGKVVAVEDTGSDRRFEMHPTAGQLGIVSAIAAPVFGPTGTCGVLTVGDTKRRKFDLSATHFIQSMANVVGIALQRSAAR